MRKHPFAKSFIAGLIGTSIEWYDYGLFGYLAPVLAELFFPSTQKWVGLLQAFMVFAIGYFLRPIGGMIFGSIADRYGRVAALRSTILLISLPSLLIAILPTYASAGLFSQFALVLLRLLQGLSVGGEFAGSMVYLTEIAPPRFRALFSGFANNASDIGVLIGVGLCCLLSTLMSHELFYSIGWRLPFLFGGIFGIVGYRMRKVFIESEAFLELQKKKQLHKKPLRVLFQQYPRKLIFGTLLCWMGACSVYTITVYLSTYLNAVKHYPMSSALALQSLLLVGTLIFVPLASLLSNYYNKITLLKGAALGNILYAAIAFHILPENNLALAGLALFPLLIFISVEQGLMPSTLAELFPVAVRYTGMSLCYNISYAYIGGAAPMYLTWLIHQFKNPLIPAYCIILTSAATGLALLELFPAQQTKTPLPVLQQESPHRA